MNYCILDTETSGFSYKHNALCQLSAIVIDDKFNELERFDMYLKPQPLLLYTNQAYDVNKLSLDFLETYGVNVSYLTQHFREFIHRNKVEAFVGHNINFDLRFCISTFDNVDFSFYISGLKRHDTKEIAKTVTNIKKLTLDNLCRKFNIEHKNDHNAIHDCESTVKLFELLTR